MYHVLSTFEVSGCVVLALAEESTVRVDIDECAESSTVMVDWTSDFSESGDECDRDEADAANLHRSVLAQLVIFRMSLNAFIRWK